MSGRRGGSAWSRLQPALRAGRQSVQSAVRASVPVVRGWARRGRRSHRCGRARRRGSPAHAERTAQRGAVRGGPPRDRHDASGPEPAQRAGWGPGRRAAGRWSSGSGVPSYRTRPGARQMRCASLRWCLSEGASYPTQLMSRRERPGRPRRERACGRRGRRTRACWAERHEDSGAAVPTGDGASKRKSKSVESAPPTPQRPRRATKRTPGPPPQGGSSPPRVTLAAGASRPGCSFVSVRCRGVCSQRSRDDLVSRQRRRPRPPRGRPGRRAQRGAQATHEQARHVLPSLHPADGAMPRRLRLLHVRSAAARGARVPVRGGGARSRGPGAAAGCREALFTLGDRPERRYAVARRARGARLRHDARYPARCATRARRDGLAAASESRA